MRKPILAALLLAFAAPARAWEFDKNPDRFPSVTLLENAGEVANGQDDLHGAKGVDSSRPSHAFLLNGTLSATLPLSQSWSLLAGGGLNLNEVDRPAGATQAAIVNDSSSAIWFAGLRRYFVGFLDTELSRENPDRWASASLQFTGAQSVNFEVFNSQNGLGQASYSRSWALIADARLPLAKWYTLVPILTGTYSHNNASETDVLPGSASHLKTLAGTLEQRFYFVGRSLITDDAHVNPDKWPLIYLGTGGSGTLAGDGTSTAVGAQNSAEVNDNVAGVSGYLGLRLPVTNSTTIKLEYDQSFTETNTGGTRIRVSTLGGLASVRYYFQ